MGAANVRLGAESDLPVLTRIYNHYVRETPATFDLEPFSPEERRSWLAGFSSRGRHRLVVVEEAGEPVGFATSHRFRDRAAYETSVETTVYLDPRHLGRGLGALLYARLFEELGGEDLHRALAGITLPNPASIALHRRFGFRPVGVFREVGSKFGRYWDVEWFEKELGVAS